MKSVIAGLAVLTFLTNPAIGTYQYIDYTWHEYNGHEYASTFSVGPWNDVSEEARSLGAHLVTINDGEENAWIVDTFHFPEELSDTTAQSRYAAWIGYHKIDGVWEWENGEPVTYENISSLFRDPGPHMYIHTSSHSEPGTWNYNNYHDVRSDHYLHGIIEIPEPTTILLLALGGLVLRRVTRSN